MNDALIIVKAAAYQGRQSEEILDAVLSLALFDLEHRVVFFGAGLSWLNKQQAPSKQKSLAKQLAALPMYGSDKIYYCAQHLPPETGVADFAKPVSTIELGQWLRAAKRVEVF